MLTCYYDDSFYPYVLMKMTSMMMLLYHHPFSSSYYQSTILPILSCMIAVDTTHRVQCKLLVLCRRLYSMTMLLLACPSLVDFVHNLILPAMYIHHDQRCNKILFGEVNANTNTSLILNLISVYDVIMIRLVHNHHNRHKFALRCTLNCAHVPFSTFTSDAGIKAEPSLLSAVIALISTVHVIPSYRHRTYRLLHIMKVLRFGW